MSTIIDGKKIAQEIKDEVKTEVLKLNDQNLFPALAVIIVGDDAASKIYVRDKKRACENTGIKSVSYELPADTTENELLHLVSRLNADYKIHGILVQLPLPQHINEDNILLAIDPKKDVDCFHPYNVGLLSVGKPQFLPGTPAGVIQLLKRSGISIAGKNCVVVGRSNIVGKPMSALLLAENGTVTTCHSKTRNLGEVTKKAEILVVAIRMPKFITADMVGEGAVVIDVGIHKIAGTKNKLCGDVDFDGVYEKTSYITPVPGGVGPMTIAMLMQNCLKAAKL
ncbi:MAG: bifunctional methylenetetrahydrofolate dehydrogenase/methenyltetrahydrofolate cyclohydrolase FolD [Clostridiales bacterium]|nr:bifunctional methylenetetrahydrofolate dehydrogenase/methenyltetrahydrofolate cyclohydrolase FolD [Clostridiales bacterium]